MDGEIKAYFEKTSKTIPASKFRKGDFILLYAQESDGELVPTRNQIIKGNLKELNEDGIVVSPMNRHLDEGFFKSHKNWAIEADLFELGFDIMYQSLFQFLKGKKRKKEVLLGLAAPTFREWPEAFPKGFKAKQLELLNRALSANDFFLLQGPPGTGKTKFMVRELVRHLLQSTDEKVLLLAFTNRAVDEICEAISLIDPRPTFFRLGYSDSTEHKEALLSNYAKSRKITEIKKAIQNCRIIISTVLTLQRNPELTDNVKFHTAIVDEASQLLEPQIIGVLCHVDRFILIGDEKQLPAIVIQSDESLQVSDSDLNNLEIGDLKISLFERLLKRCKAQGWVDAFGMLVDQGRMHEDLQELPNSLFYNKSLRTISERQETKIAPFLSDVDNPLTRILKEKRSIFIATEAEKKRNQNGQEVAAVKKVIEHLWPCFEIDEHKEQAIGVITPYRAQIASIRNVLDKEVLNFISIDTVERYQGSQRRVIIISFAVNDHYQLELLQVLNKDKTVDRKLNVALTRASDCLVLIGCPEVLVSAPIYDKLIDFYKKRKAVYRFSS